MNEVFEKIIEKLEELHERYINQYGAVGGNPMAFSVKECMEIVKQEAEQYEECYKDCGDCEAYNIETDTVKHGSWFLLDECANEGVYCSVCHKKVYKTDYANQKIKSKYCPNCGAIMDLDGE